MASNTPSHLPSPHFDFDNTIGMFRTQQNDVILQYPYDIKELASSSDKSEFHVNHLKKQFRDMARPNMFKVFITPPQSLLKDWGSDKIGLLALAKSASFPQISIGEWVYERAGQRLYIPTNDVDYGELTIGFYNDVDFNVRTLFNRWQKLAVFNWEQNVGSIPLAALANRLLVYQYDGALNPVYAAEFTNAWPQTVSAIELSQETVNTAEEFTVTFKFTKQSLYRNFDRINN